MDWSAAQYVVFEDERSRPVRDLLAAVPAADARAAVDIGCGPGNSTEILAARFPGAAITGFDSSPDMVAAARKRLPALRFEVAAIESWRGPGGLDAILANASLHWVPGHDLLLPRLIGELAPDGSLAIQLPDNLDEPAQRAMDRIAAEGPWAERLAGARGSRTKVTGADWYYDLLRPHCAAVNIWRTTYYHRLAGGPAAIVEWFRGSGLRPFLAPLDASEQAAFLAGYAAAVAEAYPSLPDGAALLPFPRLFIVATR
jgi:trans-aconitate 2-methyltransferase